MKQIGYFVLFLLLLFTFVSCKRKSKRKDSTSIQQEQIYDYYVQVVGITDGDTFDGLTHNKIDLRFRIYGIDAPEKKQAFSDKSKKYLSDLIYGKTVGIKVQKKRDGFGRPIVWVYTPEGKDVGAEMLRAGMAWHSTKYDKTQQYAELESQAKKNKIGLWKDNNPISPWNYRKKNK